MMQMNHGSFVRDPIKNGVLLRETRGFNIILHLPRPQSLFILVLFKVLLSLTHLCVLYTVIQLLY